MRILMLGWEFPPFIAGGLGVACYGLTRSLDERGHEITFVLPRAIEGAGAVGGGGGSGNGGRRTRVLGTRTPEMGDTGGGAGSRLGVTFTREEFTRTVFHAVPASSASPYGTASPSANTATASPEAERTGANSQERASPGGKSTASMPIAQVGGAWTRHATPYGGDLLADADRYASAVAAIARDAEFDIVHAHDWLTFPAGAAASAVLGCPWVAHVHSTEFDRSGSNINPRIYDLERRGMHGATRVIAVSQLTKASCVSRYGVDPSKIDVVYNGIRGEGGDAQNGKASSGERANGAPPRATPADSSTTDKTVLFLGRITMQKGPEYFLQAARRVLSVEPGTRFVVAGSGDLDGPLRELARELGIEARVHFTGFLRGRDVHHALSVADCFVMPSVSEPFGLVALEAAQRGVPVILSRQSGVSEVLRHVLKVDFWDVEDLANKIVGVLRSPGLARTLVENNTSDLLALSWDASAELTEEVYARALRESPWLVAGGRA